MPASLKPPLAGLGASSLSLSDPSRFLRLLRCFRLRCFRSLSLLSESEESRRLCLLPFRLRFFLSRSRLLLRSLLSLSLLSLSLLLRFRREGIRYAAPSERSRV